MRGYRTTEYRIGSGIFSVTPEEQRYADTIAFVPTVIEDRPDIIYVGKDYDRNGRALLEPGLKEDIGDTLSHETLHQVLNRDELEYRGHTIDRFTAKHGMKYAVGTRAHLRARHLPSVRIGREVLRLSDRQLAARAAASRKRLRERDGR